jgi:hypothetical protein
MYYFSFRVHRKCLSASVHPTFIFPIRKPRIDLASIRKRRRSVRRTPRRQQPRLGDANPTLHHVSRWARCCTCARQKQKREHGKVLTVHEELILCIRDS